MKNWTWWGPLKVLLVMAAFLFVSANLVFGTYYLDRIYPGVEVAGINIGGLTRVQAKQQLTEYLQDYKLDIQLDDEHYELDPERLGVEYDLEFTLDQAWMEGRYNFPPLLGLIESRKSNGLSYAYQLDRVKLDGFVSEIVSSKSQAPVDASIVVTDGQPRVEPEKAGQGIDKQAFTRMVQTAFESHTPSVSLQRQILPAQVTAVDLEATLSDAKKLVGTRLELKYAEKTFVPTAKVIGSWLTYVNDNHQPKTIIDRGKMEPYLKTVAAAIYVAPKNHLINVQNGATTGEEPGVEGLEIDKDDLAGAIIAAMNGAAGTKIEIKTRPIAFKTVYNRTVNLDFGRYIEINLSSQHLWVYQDHKSIFDTAITSGATGAGYGTVTGLFDIKAKQRDRNLNGYAIGYNYNVFVQYWMPFFGNYGMHDASWRSSFGGPDYYYNGSHGCVNMPLESAAWIFNWADVGTPVWVHT